MKFPAYLLLLALVIPASGAELSPDVLKRAKSRIEALLGNRRGASPTPVDPANPFVLPQTATVAVQVENTPVADAPVTKVEALTRLAASLNVSGYIQIQGQPHLIINRQTYRENDLIPVRDAAGSISFLLLKKITETEFILELDGVEHQQKHTVK